MVKMFLNFWNSLLLFLRIKKPIVVPSVMENELFYGFRKNFPEVGKLGRVYLDKETLTVYMWTGTAYEKLQGMNVEDMKPMSELCLPLGGYKPGELVVFGAFNPGAKYKTNFTAAELQRNIESTAQGIPKL